VTLYRLPSDVSIGEAISLAGILGRLKIVETAFDWRDRYTLWSGLIGGFFLALAYFGTDQSQVQRYLTARSTTETRLGLLFNGLAKVPMQFFILFVGVMVFVFYQFVTPPLFFNPREEARMRAGPHAEEYRRLQAEHGRTQEQKRARIGAWLAASRGLGPAAEREARDRLAGAQRESEAVRGRAVELIAKSDATANANDTNYVFLTFVTRYLPEGLVGLVIVVVFGATMASTSSELNSLATCSVVDIYKRLVRPEAAEGHYVRASRLATAGWGLFAISVSERASRLGTLVEAVNILGSLFYGTVLGVFVVAFGLKRVSGTAAFFGALVGEAVVLMAFFLTEIPYLWYNVLGTVAVVVAALLWTAVRGRVIPSARAES
jgi:Na+/proline symporter